MTLKAWNALSQEDREKITKTWARATHWGGNPTLINALVQEFARKYKSLADAEYGPLGYCRVDEKKGCAFVTLTYTVGLRRPK